MLTDAQRSIIRSTVPVLQEHGEAITTYFYKTLFAEHPELLNIFNKANQRPGGQAASLAASILMYAAHIDHLEQLTGMVERIAHKHGSMEVQPEHYPIVGDHLLRAIRGVLKEAATDSVLDAWSAAYGDLADIFIGREKQLYAENAEKPGGWWGYKPFKVSRKVKESSSITSFYLVPEDGAPLPSFSPGQYLGIKLKTSSDANEQIRQYSLSCKPNAAYYRISVGRESANRFGAESPEGVVSTYLQDEISEGDVILVHAPLGDFTLDETTSSPVVLISGGVGITPMLSMLERLAETGERKVTFVHGTGGKSQHAFQKHVRKIASESPHVKVVITYDEVETDDIRGEHHDESGFIDAALLKRHIADLESEFYYCGPAPFLRAVENALNTLGVPSSRQRSEAFAPNPSFLITTKS